MIREELIASVSGVIESSEEHAAEYARKGEIMAEKVNERIIARGYSEDVGGSDNIEVMKDNHRNHVKFITSSIRKFNPETFVEIIIWVYKTYQSRGFKPDYWRHQLAIWLDVIDEELPPATASAVKPLYEWLIANHASFLELSLQEKTIWEKSRPGT